MSNGTQAAPLASLAGVVDVALYLRVGPENWPKNRQVKLERSVQEQLRKAGLRIVSGMWPERSKLSELWVQIYAFEPGGACQTIAYAMALDGGNKKGSQGLAGRQVLWPRQDEDVVTWSDPGASFRSRQSRRDEEACWDYLEWRVNWCVQEFIADYKAANPGREGNNGERK